uniref:Uncharacterized protein n=1 Tax=Faecalibaculum rodentium TaxID=1702221 RepID=A0A140DXQ3_9FIRM|nr:hypothetical protein AALO17_22960 [Faecalibaculum rodentium]
MQIQASTEIQRFQKKCITNKYSYNIQQESQNCKIFKNMLPGCIGYIGE